MNSMQSCDVEYACAYLPLLADIKDTAGIPFPLGVAFSSAHPDKQACAAQEHEHELTQQLASTAGSVVSLKAQQAALNAEAEGLQRQLQMVKQDYRIMALKLEDRVRALSSDAHIERIDAHQDFEQQCCMCMIHCQYISHCAVCEKVADVPVCVEAGPVPKPLCHWDWLV